MPHAPALGSVGPNTIRRMRASTAAPAHIGQGSSVTNRSQSSSRQSPRAAAAWRMAIISACAVGSLSAIRRLCPLPITCPLQTMTQPMGTSSMASASRALLDGKPHE